MEEVTQRRKEEILKYKKNAVRLTKKQELANILRGQSSVYGRRTWAKQTQTTTNNNYQNLERRGNSLIFPAQVAPVKNPVPLYGIAKRYKYTG